MTRQGWRFPAERRHVLKAADRLDRLPPEPVLRNAGIEANDIVIDVGAGTGYWTEPLSHLVGPKGHVIALDVEPIMLDELRALVRQASLSNVEVVGADEYHFPLPAAGADAAVLGFVLHEPADPARFLAEVGRVLRVQARVLVLDWQKRKTWAGPPLPNRLAPEETAALLEDAGYAVAAVPVPDGDIYALLGTRT